MGAALRVWVPERGAPRGFWQAGCGQLAELQSVGPFSRTLTGKSPVHVRAKLFSDSFYLARRIRKLLDCALSAAPIFKHGRTGILACLHSSNTKRCRRMTKGRLTQFTPFQRVGNGQDRSPCVRPGNCAGLKHRRIRTETTELKTQRQTLASLIATMDARSACVVRGASRSL